MLQDLHTIPINTAVVAGLYPHIKSKAQKVADLERAGSLIRLKRNLYVVSPSLSGVPLSTELIANQLYGPSYLSLQSALRYYGLIPEAVYQHLSMTIKHSRSFTTPVGHFHYQQCTRDYFAIGLTIVQRTGYAFIIATPEKALADLITYTKGLNMRYRKEILTYLKDDLRFDMDAFFAMDATIFEACAALGKKATTMKAIAKLLRDQRSELSPDF